MRPGQEPETARRGRSDRSRPPRNGTARNGPSSGQLAQQLGVVVRAVVARLAGVARGPDARALPARSLSSPESSASAHRPVARASSVAFLSALASKVSRPRSRRADPEFRRGHPFHAGQIEDLADFLDLWGVAGSDQDLHGVLSADEAAFESGGKCRQDFIGNGAAVLGQFVGPDAFAAPVPRSRRLRRRPHAAVGSENRRNIQFMLTRPTTGRRFPPIRTWPLLPNALVAVGIAAAQRRQIGRRRRPIAAVVAPRRNRRARS